MTLLREWLAIYCCALMGAAVYAQGILRYGVSDGPALAAGGAVMVMAITIYRESAS
jgi:TRAP-type C4-dicarboxylate transport system permease small subunit